MKKEIDRAVEDVAVSDRRSSVGIKVDPMLLDECQNLGEKLGLGQLEVLNKMMSLGKRILELRSKGVSGVIIHFEDGKTHFEAKQ